MGWLPLLFLLKKTQVMLGLKFREFDRASAIEQDGKNF